MNQRQFMLELRRALEGHLPEEEIEEILSDHREFFEVGLAEGSTEESIAQQLGDPAKIALSLIKKDAPLPGRRRSGITFSKAPTHLRVLAFIVDIMVSVLPFALPTRSRIVMSFFSPHLLRFLVQSLLSTIRYSGHSWIASARMFWTAGVILSCLWFVFINPVCLMLSHGQTLGMKLFGLRVVSKNSGLAGGDRRYGRGAPGAGQCLRPATPAQYLVRETIGKLGLNGIFAAVWLPLGFLPTLASLVWNLLSPEGATVWDTIAGTRVVEATAGRREG